VSRYCCVSAGHLKQHHTETSLCMTSRTVTYELLQQRRHAEYCRCMTCKSYCVIGRQTLYRTGSMLLSVIALVEHGWTVYLVLHCLLSVVVLLRCIREFSCAVHGMEVCFGWVVIFPDTVHAFPFHCKKTGGCLKSW